jgi:excinuclease ABC subunit A
LTTEKTHILIKGAKVHNLKNIDLDIERDKFIVITGLSGSGKSSLAFDTIYAEGQRRYIESLSSYARQFLGRIKKPEVDYIKGLPPAIAIEQKVNTRNPRSTVGTSTEIYDYFKLLFARIGKTYSPISGKEVKRHSVTDVVEYISNLDSKAKVLILTPIIIPKDRFLNEQLNLILQQGYSRIEVYKNKISEIYKIDEVLKNFKLVDKYDDLNILIDRVKPDKSEDSLSRIADSVQTAFFESKGNCKLKIICEDSYKIAEFSNKFEEDGIDFEIPTVHTFTFNSPAGACKRCEGFGKIIGIDEELVVPNKSLSIYEEAIACWKGEKMSWFKDQFVMIANSIDFPIHKPYNQLSDKENDKLWNGNSTYSGINDFFEQIEKETHKIQYRVMLSRYRGKTVCPECKGSRLKKEASYIKVGEKSIQDLVLMQLEDLIGFFKTLKLNEYEEKISKRILIEINNRIEYLINVGLGYLTLNRLSSTLSGGESQRINLATSLGSSLVGSAYILDEPSIGLHSKDSEKLINVLKQLKDLGNTVIVVEHDEEMIRAAEDIIDIGPLAGTQGGNVVFQGNHKQLLNSDSLTAKYLTGKLQIEVPKNRRKPSKSKGSIEIKGARENNLKNINTTFHLGLMTVVTGVSGSGKSSLIRDVFLSALRRQFDIYGDKLGKFDSITGDFIKLQHVEFVDQNPIGRSSRSNPVTYIKAYDDIRKLFSEQQASLISGFKPAHFSFNVDGGRCEECQGEGIINVEMQFMADVTLICESCGGHRFKEEILEVKFLGRNIFDVLEMTIDEALVFFNGKSTTEKKIAKKLQVLVDVGLGYVRLGQSSSTLSGGESQRIKLASFLVTENTTKSTLFIFDEPTTGLHFHDIKKLLDAFNALLDRGHTVIIIEHNMEIIKSADWVIDLGPEGGEKGGHIIFEGTPEDLVKCKKSYTGKYLKEKL